MPDDFTASPIGPSRKSCGDVGGRQLACAPDWQPRRATWRCANPPPQPFDLESFARDLKALHDEDAIYAAEVARLEALEAHAKAAELVAVADIDPAALDRAVAATGARGFASIEALLAGSDPDLVILATFAEVDAQEARRHRPTVVLVDRGNRVVDPDLAEIAGPARRTGT